MMSLVILCEQFFEDSDEFIQMRVETQISHFVTLKKKRFARLIEVQRDDFITMNESIRGFVARVKKFAVEVAIFVQDVI